MSVARKDIGGLGVGKKRSQVLWVLKRVVMVLQSRWKVLALCERKLQLFLGWTQV